jgi:hypothetical protein
VDFIIDRFSDDGANVLDLGQWAWWFAEGSEVVVRHVRDDPRSRYSSRITIILFS